jgi:type I restriction enzyme R subunit/putative DNA methylase
VNTNQTEEADGDVGAPKEWYSRGYLPHRDAKQLLQAVTFRLADSLPQEKLTQLEAELLELPENQRATRRREKIEHWLDAGMGCCALRHPKLAEQMRDSLQHFDGQRYRLIAWCIMPNHVHVLLETLTPLAKIVQGWKSITARWALTHNEEFQLGIPDPKHLWMREYWDRFIRNDTHLENVVLYIHQNPVKAGLCQRAEEWPWSSAGTPTSPSASTHRSANEDVGAPGSESRFRAMASRGSTKKGLALLAKLDAAFSAGK